MDESTVLDTVVRYFNRKGAVLFVDPGSHESYEKVCTTVSELPNCELNDSITIGGRTPDIIGILGRNEIIAVEAKGDGDPRKGIGQATHYRQGVHKSYLAAEASRLAAFDDAAHAAGVGTIPVGEDGVINDEVRPPNPQIAGTEIDSTRRAIALKTTQFESGQFVFPPMYRPENAFLPVLAIALEGENQQLPTTICEEAIRDADPKYKKAPRNPIRLAKTIQLIEQNAEGILRLTDYGQCGYNLIAGVQVSTGLPADRSEVLDPELTINSIDNHRDHDALIAFLRDRYIATPPVRLLVRILADQEESRMEVSEILSTITRESPDVFNALFCRDNAKLQTILNDTSLSDHEFRRELLDLTMATYLYNFVNQLQVIGVLSETSDKTDSNQDLQPGELYWEWDPNQVGAIGAI